ncbi:hypothetical protein Clacol_006830 [Clathrus columnatus]|uniref:Uncharacterized protein n=1 Tax=Clathrus columnatus TaxID=1419009 RepID=A0AAV5AD64_9AGAM|nr:hypothetical protein Clacol_006830 [Clathrus columnatus]
MSYGSSNSSTTLSEQQVIDGFHSFLQSALTQAKAEKLLDTETLASAEADLMVSAPALCLFFAALRSTSNPPSVPLPLKGLNASFDKPIQLSNDNCPPVFLPMFKVWESTVTIIQRMQSNRQHDLARIICNLEPHGHRHALNVIAAQLRGVAIEISQRRTFQERFQADLQAALDVNAGGTGETAKAQFTPPPSYAEKQPGFTKEEAATIDTPTDSKAKSLLEEEPFIIYIREMLFASLGDVISSTPSLKNSLKSDPSRAYFASVALAILEASLTPQGTVRGVLNRQLALEDCPVELRPLMQEFDSIQQGAIQIVAQDDEEAIQLTAEGKEVREPRIDRVRRILLDGMGEGEMSPNRLPSTDGEGLRMSIEGHALQFATQINILALRMTSLPTFRSYARNVFDILGGLA